VVYTQRKYVRKPKGANVGAVVLEREQVVMVKPALPGGAVDHSSK
jgi:predicted ribosome quality control (RQC) complex YloA/Tae2 family protein